MLITPTTTRHAPRTIIHYPESTHMWIQLQDMNSQASWMLFFGYHQIKMRPSDQVHTWFRAAGAIYYYNVMPFNLKNAGPTY